MPKLTIDGIEIEVPPGSNVLQACEALGREVPRFCYHERLSVAGNCRMCLVEMERAPKPIASCAMPAADGMVIHTNSEIARKARNGVMEFLLINHPLDCPICDQGGECDLQDQAMAYGFDRSRYNEHKRAVTDKQMGPLIKTIMTRCIHCTRCVRFATEVAGVEELGAMGRGEQVEIGTYVERALTSELSGNMIDLCPVGALTSKPYAFTARPWELRKVDSIDVMDALGSNIRIDARGSEIMRVLPRLHEEVNEEWISDKTRFACDGLKRQRLDRPYIREGGKLRPASWTDALQLAASRLTRAPAGRVAALVGDQVDAESMLLLKQMMDGLGTPHLDCRQDGMQLLADARTGYLFNSSIAGIDSSDALLLIGCNPRHEAPVLNARLRRRWLAGGFQVGSIGAPTGDLTYPCESIGLGPEDLHALLSGKLGFSKTLSTARNPMLILGQAALARPDGLAIWALAREVAEKFSMIRPPQPAHAEEKKQEGDSGWNGFNILHLAASRVGGLDLGLVPGPGGRDVTAILAGAEEGALDVIYLLGADEIDTQRLGQAFVIYQGHHGDAGAHRADVILPGAAYTEKNGTYVNLEGRVQHTNRVIFPPGEAKEDWRILRALSEKMNQTLPYDDLVSVRQGLVKAAPHFAEHDRLQPAQWHSFGVSGKLDSTLFGVAVANFYMTDPISRASATMAACTAQYDLDNAEKRNGTQG